MQRPHAVAAAEAKLVELGFKKDEKSTWLQEEPVEGGVLALQVILGKEPSHSLPQIFVDRKRLPRRVPHVERDGKICLPTRERVLLDAGDPASIVGEAVALAKNVIQDGLSGRLDCDFRQEFMAYWGSGAKEKALWPIPIPSEPQEIVLTTIRGTNDCEKLSWIGTTLEEVRTWAKRVSRDVGSFGNAFFIPLATAFDPPDFEDWTFREFLQVFETTQSVDVVATLTGWLSQQDTPATLFFSLPGVDGNDVVIAGMRFPRGKKLKDNAFDDITSRLDDRIERIEVERIDPNFLTARAGSSVGLHGKTVTIVGCGAVGSQIASQLALLGVGRLQLVDGQTLESENIHRHFLGLRHLGKFKAVAIASELRLKYPNIQTVARPFTVEELHERDPAFLWCSDLIIFSTGDHNLELQFNSLLLGGPPRIHTWLEPLGIGGHAVAVGVGGPKGCFECLFKATDGAPLSNSAAFAAPIQSKDFGKSMAGCAGTFVPFSAIDAIRTATEAANLAISLLGGTHTNNQRVSWFGDPETFGKEGFNLSSEAKSLEPGTILRSETVGRSDCESCRTP